MIVTYDHSGIAISRKQQTKILNQNDFNNTKLQKRFVGEETG